MRFAFSSIFCIITGFVFLLMWGVTSYFLNEVKDAMTPYLTGTTYSNYITLIPTAFGISAALFFIVGIVLFFIVDTMSEDYEGYYR